MELLSEVMVVAGALHSLQINLVNPARKLDILPFAENLVNSARIEVGDKSDRSLRLTSSI